MPSIWRSICSRATSRGFRPTVILHDRGSGARVGGPRARNLGGTMKDLTMKDLVTASLQDYLASADELIEEARAGRMFILVDEEDRENEATSSSPRSSR